MTRTNTEDLKLLLFAGNKRSGTTMMTYLLNTHHNIYMAMEIDSIWYHYNSYSTKSYPMNYISAEKTESGDIVSKRTQVEQDIPGTFRPYSDIAGVPRVDVFGDILYTQEHGIQGRQDAYPEKDSIIWAGDKMPAQSCDPSITPWIYDNFPEVQYIHLVRHPQLSISSMMWMGWGDLKQATQHWIQLEEWAHQVSDPLFLKYEEVCANPDNAMVQVSEFLGLDSSNRVIEYDAVGRLTVKRGTIMDTSYATSARRGNPSDVPITDGLAPFMDEYGYQEIRK